MLSALPTDVAAGMAGIGGLPFGMNQAAQNVEGVRANWPTYQPRDPSSLESFGATMDKAHPLEAWKNATGGRLADAGYPGLGTAVSMAPEAAMAVLGARNLPKWAQRGPTMAKMVENAQLPRNLHPQTGAIVWHGSPHKFEKFSAMDNIGKGEGAQAYGHGGYLADTEAVAKNYKQAEGTYKRVNGGMTNKEEFIADHLSQGRPEMSILDLYAQKYGGSFDDAMKDLVNVKQLYGQGHLYKMDIPDEAVAKMLDWDKPLSEQAPGVVDALRKIDSPMVREMLQSFEIGSTHGSAVPWALKGEHGAGRAASDVLHQAGIPGIRYLDGNSRGTGGTSNYVTFDDEMVRILERNGIPTGQKPWQPGEWGKPSPAAPMYRGIEGEYDPGFRQSVEWWAENKDLAAGYGSNVIQKPIQPINPVDLGFRDYRTEVRGSDVAERVQRAITDRFQSGHIDREAALGLFADAAKLRSVDGFKQAHQWINSPEVADILQKAGFDSISHVEKGSQTYGLLRPTSN